MSPRDRTRILMDQIRRLAGATRERNLSDRELLDRFVAKCDDAAFRALMDRYAYMVLRSCQRLLGEQGEAEDAFQATFVVLASKAATIRQGESLPSWLHSVAVRVAQRALRAAKRRRVHESQAAKPEVADPSEDLTVREAQAALEEELAALPEAYRVPLLQCNLLGRRREQVAHELGYSLRTLERRLETGLRLLKSRLTARGVEVPAGLLIVLLSGMGRCPGLDR
jgi:RNA polymerase sigma factor (sigma-70 family)